MSGRRDEHLVFTSKSDGAEQGDPGHHVDVAGSDVVEVTEVDGGDGAGRQDSQLHLAGHPEDGEGAGGEQGGGDVLLPGQGAVRGEVEDRHAGVATHCSCVGEVLALEDVLHLKLDRVCCCFLKHFLGLLKLELLNFLAANIQ